MNIQELKKEIPCKWRVQSFSKNVKKGQCVAYIDSRQVQDLLDEVCGAENWQDDYKDVGGQTFAGIGIKIDSDWVWKWDTGSESNIEKEKGQASDSFKRAAVKWGVGRFLYEKEIVLVESDALKVQGKFPNAIDSNGKRIYNLTEHINKLQKTGTAKVLDKKEEQKDNTEATLQEEFNFDDLIA